MFIGLIECQRPRRVLARRHRISDADEIVGHDRVRGHQQTLVVAFPRQPEHLLGNIHRRLQVALVLKELPEPEQNRKELRCIADFVTECARPLVRCARIGMPESSERPHCQTESQLQLELHPRALR